MCAALACPNCRYRMELSGLTAGADLRCPDCDRTYKVPTIPRRLLRSLRRSQIGSATVRANVNAAPGVQTGRRLAGHSNGTSTFLWLVASLPLLLLLACVLPGIASHTANGHTPRPAGIASPTIVVAGQTVSADAGEAFSCPVIVSDCDLPSGSVLAATDSDRLNNLAGRYRLLEAMNEQQEMVFGTSWALSPLEELQVSVHPDLHRLAVDLVWNPAESRSWLHAERLVLDDRLGFPADPVWSAGRPSDDWQLAMNFVRFSEPDLSVMGAAATAESSLFVNQKLSLRKSLLNHEEWMRGGRLRNRECLATILTTWELSGETLTICRQAFGADVKTVKCFIASATGRQLASRARSSAQTDQFLAAFMEGQSLKLQRIH